MDSLPTSATTPPVPPPAAATPPPPLFPEWPGSIQALYSGAAAASTSAPVFYPWARPAGDRAAPHPYMMAPYGAPVPLFAPPSAMFARPSPGQVYIAAEADRRMGDSSKSVESLMDQKPSDKVAPGSPDESASQSHCESEGSYETRGESIYRQSKKGFSSTLGDGGVTHSLASIQNASSSESSPIAKHPVFQLERTMSLNPAMDLNAGMESRNSFHTNMKVRNNAINIATQMDTSTKVRREGRGHPQMRDDRELRRERRKQSNRESARRSRLRKLECEDLTRRVDELSDETIALRSELDQINKDCEDLESQNDSIEEDLVRQFGPDILSALNSNIMVHQ